MPATMLLNYSVSVEPERWPTGSDGAVVSSVRFSFGQSNRGSVSLNRPHEKSVRRPRGSGVHIGGEEDQSPRASWPEARRPSKNYCSIHSHFPEPLRPPTWSDLHSAAALRSPRCWNNWRAVVDDAHFFSCCFIHVLIQLAQQSLSLLCPFIAR